MRALKVIGMLLAICVCGVCFMFTCYNYEFYKDDFTYFSFNVVDEEEESKSNEVIAKPEGDTSNKFPDISFSTIFNPTFRYYQILGWFFTFAFLASFDLMFLLYTRFCKVKFYSFIKERDNLILIIMSSVLLSFFVLFGDVIIYNKYFLNGNGAAAFNTVETQSEEETTTTSSTQESMETTTVYVEETTSISE